VPLLLTARDVIDAHGESFRVAFVASAIIALLGAVASWLLVRTQELRSVYGRRASIDLRLELVVLPISDVDRAKAFYVDQFGFHADHDHVVTPEVWFRAAHTSRFGVLDRLRDRPDRHCSRFGDGPLGGDHGHRGDAAPAA
jgi:hypothetical protein